MRWLARKRWRAALRYPTMYQNKDAAGVEEETPFAILELKVAVLHVKTLPTAGFGEFGYGSSIIVAAGIPSRSKSILSDK